ncbi:tRNA guanosine(34) transglycosylase Tgt [Chlorella virus XW01]|nr:tRNA guanosine(34) transglycosylase Tgt [Chlorella virus XW01]
MSKIITIIRFILLKIYFYFIKLYVNKIKNNNFQYKILYQNGKLKTSIIKTPHGIINTPAFIFCATKASMKSTTIENMEKNKTQIILSNTYHLALKGHLEIKSIGGLHKALCWNKPMLTDSGGYQIFAMKHLGVSNDINNDIKGKRNLKWQPSLISIDENKAVFENYYDKSKFELTPEKSIQIQKDLGADLVVVLDECTSSKDDYDYTKMSLERNHNWELKSLKEFKRINDGKQALYGIVQGGIYKDLRKISCEFVNKNDFFGVCIGGCLGNNTEEMHEIVNYTMNYLRNDRPVHLLGIGYIRDIFNGVRNGIDTFDCVHPSRVSRRGMAYIPAYLQNTDREIKTNLLNINNNNNIGLIDNNCGCSTCKKGYDRQYLKLLIKQNELMVYNLITDHNIYFFNKLFEDIRNGIINNNLDEIEAYYIK